MANQLLIFVNLQNKSDYPSFPAQVVDGLAVFAAAECKIVPLRRLKGAEPVDGDLYFIMSAEERFFYQHDGFT
jgi:hypothetical protein